MKRRTANWLVGMSLVAATLALVSEIALPVNAAVPFNCRFVSCPCPACEYGEHLETPPGQCCPVCVPD